MHHLKNLEKDTLKYVLIVEMAIILYSNLMKPVHGAFICLYFSLEYLNKVDRRVNSGVNLAFFSPFE
jgi:hypothetical protein